MWQLKRIELGINYLKTGEQLEIELFNKKRYRLTNGQAKMQIPLFVNGKTTYSDFGKDVAITSLFDQIKCVYHNHKLLALRMKEGEPLVLRQKFSSQVLAEKKKRKEAQRAYQEFLANEFHSWLNDIRSYCYENY